MNWCLWAALLIVQNFSFVLVSRARNSGSLGYHAIASVFSNGVWFASQFILIGTITDAIKNSSTGQAVKLGIFYTVFTLLGSISSHWFSMKYLEKGKRKVGSNA
jgi:hypothetical protein